MPAYGVLGSVRNAVVFVKAAEMIDPDHVIKFKAMLQSLAPPCETGLPVVIPFIQGIAPELSCGRESVGRTSRHGRGLIFRIELEHLRMSPGIRRVKCHINGNVPDEPNPVVVGIFLQLLPLDMELELKIFIEFDVKIAFPSIIIQCVGPALFDILRPFAPGSSVKPKLHGHKERVILQPV